MVEQTEEQKQSTRVVWILGAGFSKSLGAPLLGELLSQESLHRIFKLWPSDVVDPVKARQVVRLYLGGVHGIPHIKDNVERHWEHAEEFLEKLDRAKTSDLDRSVLERLSKQLPVMSICGENAKTAHMFTGGTIAEAHLMALKLMAGECCAFLDKADLNSERWQPYVRWAKSLGPNDTVITFNYDRVPDLLANEVRESRRIVVPTPNHVENKQATAGTPALVAQMGVKVLKLHGSVNWHMANNGIREAAQESLAVYLDDLEKFAMATPGPTKRNMIGGTIPFGGKEVDAPLRPLWEAARKAIKQAHTIAMVGYRMPATDAYTREWLMDAIRENTRMNACEHGSPTWVMQKYQVAAANPLVVHTVLGSNVNHEHPQRLMWMLDELDLHRRIRVDKWPMFAEDFIGLVDRRRLLPPE